MSYGFKDLRSNFSPEPDPQRRVGFSDDNARILYASRNLTTVLDHSDRYGPGFS